MALSQRRPHITKRQTILPDIYPFSELFVLHRVTGAWSLSQPGVYARGLRVQDEDPLDGVLTQLMAPSLTHYSQFRDTKQPTTRLDWFPVKETDVPRGNPQIPHMQ